MVRRAGGPWWLELKGRFFFSSRRRHTRYWRDWSSDVCSSDLLLAERVLRLRLGPGQGLDLAAPQAVAFQKGHTAALQGVGIGDEQPARAVGDQHRRSEERRVGKECRSRWLPYH